MIRPFWGGRQLLGLQIQSDGIRVVQARREADGLMVSRFANFPLAPGVIIEGKVQGWDDLEHALREIQAAWQVRGSSVVTCIPAQLVRTQKMMLPSSMQGIELERAIRVQLLRELVGVVDSMHFDYSKVPSDDEGYQQLIVTAARQEYVQRFVQVFETAGFKLKIIDVDVYALQRVYQQESAILFIAVDQVILIIMDEHAVLFHQQWVITSADAFYREFKSALQLCRALHGEAICKTILLCGDFRLFALQPEQLQLVGDCFVSTQTEWRGIHFVQALEGVSCHAEFAIALGLLQREISWWL